MDAYQSYIHKSRYARYIPGEQRRESWDETINRYLDFFTERGQLDPKTRKELYTAIHDMEIMPSMRALMTAGQALEKDNVAGFNCSYLTIDHPRAFDELLYVLMCGTGVGFFSRTPIRQQITGGTRCVPSNRKYDICTRQ